MESKGSINEHEVKDDNEIELMGIDLRESMNAKPKFIRTMKKRQEATGIIGFSISGREMIDQANFALIVSDHPKKPDAFTEAWNHPIEDH